MSLPPDGGVHRLHLGPQQGQFASNSEQFLVRAEDTRRARSLPRGEKPRQEARHDAWAVRDAGRRQMCVVLRHGPVVSFRMGECCPVSQNLIKSPSLQSRIVPWRALIGKLRTSRTMGTAAENVKPMSAWRVHQPPFRDRSDPYREDPDHDAQSPPCPARRHCRGSALPAAFRWRRRAGARAPAVAPAQAPGFYRFRVGSFIVTTVHDGFFARPLDGFVRNTPLAEVQARLREPSCRLTVTSDPVHRHLRPARRYARGVRRRQRRDGGRGDRGRMIANMAAAGIDPARVTHVIHSHFHGDHINGLLERAERPRLPQCRGAGARPRMGLVDDGGQPDPQPRGPARHLRQCRAPLRPLSRAA
jgi:hypothetical protein